MATTTPVHSGLTTAGGLGIAALGGIAGGLGSPTSGTTSTQYQLTPEQQALLSSLYTGAQGLTTPSLTGYAAQQTQGINQNTNLQEQSVNNIMASRGLATSPVSGTSQANIEAQRTGAITNMQEGLPLLKDQLNIQNLGAANNVMASSPKNVTQTSSSLQGGGIGGAAGGIGAILASLFSDKRLKEEIEPISSKKAVERIMALTPSRWKWKGSEVKDAGVIAQDLKLVMPELVDADEKGINKVNYAGLISELIGAVQGIAIAQQQQTEGAS